MKIPRHLLISVLIATLLIGCGAMGPRITSPEFPVLVAKVVPKEDGKVRTYSRGSWFPNTRGHSDTSIIHVNDNYRMGVLVITDGAVLFLQWDSREKVFYVVKRLPYQELMEASIDRFGLNAMVVLRKKDLSYDSFELVNSGGAFIDEEKTKQVVDILRRLIKS